MCSKLADHAIDESAVHPMTGVRPPQSDGAILRAQPGVRVLVAEDDPVMLAMYRELLSEMGHMPICATNGGEAWALYERYHPPLVLLDVAMPVMTGLEISQRIRGSQQGLDTFILVITGYDREGDILSRVLDAGGDDFLGKPVDADLFHARITIALRNIHQRHARRAAERALARAQWLAGIGETSLALQHEINNPLTAILGNASLLEMDDFGGDESRELVHTIAEQARRIGEVVRRLAALKNPRSVPYLEGATMLDLSSSSSSGGDTGGAS